MSAKPTPILPAAKGWKAVLDAVPYALWWLVMIETVALAAEEAHEPQRTLARGLVWAQLTLIVLVVLTWFFACGAVDSQELAVTRVREIAVPRKVEDSTALKGKQELSLDPTPQEKDQFKEEYVEYPLAKAFEMIPAGKSKLLAVIFGAIALFGMIASYHGMVYGTSRQAFALGRAGYLPAFLGKVDQKRRTPVPALLTTSLITAGFVVANIWFKDAIAVALLVSTLSALIWYILAMGCLYILRRREPELFQGYRAPLTRILPITVLALSLFAVYVYSGIDVKVIPLTALLYAVGLVYFWFWAHPRIQLAAPEERTASMGKLP